MTLELSCIYSRLRIPICDLQALGGRANITRYQFVCGYWFHNLGSVAWAAWLACSWGFSDYILGALAWILRQPIQFLRARNTLPGHRVISAANWTSMEA